MNWRTRPPAPGRRLALLSLPLLAAALVAVWPRPPGASAQSELIPVRRVNMPYVGTPPPGQQPQAPAVFWFGQVDPTGNYADVRTDYVDDAVRLTVHVIDRLLWYDTTPAAADLTTWDAVSLYLDLDGNTGGGPDGSSYRFVAQLNHWQARTNYQAAYRGANGAWMPAAAPFATTSGWRGGGLNDTGNDRGWLVSFNIPFSSLGLAGRPPAGTVWGLALQLHDRDDAAGAAIPDRIWPETMNPSLPSSWGQAAFGLPSPGNLPAIPRGTVTIRQGLNGALVPDVQVGGDTVCGQPYAPNYFNGWGTANYAGLTHANVQNQWDIADWPCFSRYYLTFPLNAVPAGRAIISARLTLHQIGTLGNNSVPSWIQVLTVGEAWNEATLTWNNAPLAVENIGGAWVPSLTVFPGWPGVAREWDVTRALNQALAAGQPLRLALYSADWDYHTGRHFVTSETGDWNAVARPTLQVRFGDLCTLANNGCTFVPLARR